jgi:hypothetical protein
MSNWEQCRNYGLTTIESNNVIRLYYNQFGYCLAGNPSFLQVQDAYWQGDNLVIKGVDTSGYPRVYIMNGFNNYRQI